MRIPLLLPFRVAKGNWVAEFVIRDVDRIFHSKGWELRGVYYTRVFKEALGSMPGCSLIHNVSDTRQRGRRGATRITATPSTGHPKIFSQLHQFSFPIRYNPCRGQQERNPYTSKATQGRCSLAAPAISQHNPRTRRHKDWGWVTRHPSSFWKS